MVPVVATALIALVIAFSGGFDSFGYRLFVLVAVFYGLYFSVHVILLGMFGVVAAGASPMLYEPDLLELLEFLVVPVPLHLTVALVCNHVVRRAERQEQARVVSEARLRRERERGERLRREAEVDGLTGLSNRRHLEGRLDEEIERAEHFGERFALLFADLDGFKAVNDEHGHLLGDDALRLVARSLSENARQIDVVARYGAEEFVVLLPGTTPEGAADRAMSEAKRRGRMGSSSRKDDVRTTLGNGYPLEACSLLEASSRAASPRRSAARSSGSMASRTDSESARHEVTSCSIRACPSPVARTRTTRRSSGSMRRSTRPRSTRRSTSTVALENDPPSLRASSRIRIASSSEIKSKAFNCGVDMFNSSHGAESHTARRWTISSCNSRMLLTSSFCPIPGILLLFLTFFTLCMFKSNRF